MKKAWILILIMALLFSVGCQKKPADQASTAKDLVAILETPQHLDLIQSLQVRNQPGMQWLEREQSYFKEAPKTSALQADEIYWELRVYDNPESQESVNSKGYFFKDPDICFSTDESREWVEGEKRPYLYGQFLHLMESLSEKLESPAPESDTKEVSANRVFQGSFTPEELKALDGMGEFFNYLSEEDTVILRFECVKAEDKEAFSLQHVMITGKTGEDTFSLKEAVFKDGGHKGLGKILPPSLVKVIVKNGLMIDPQK